MLAFGYPPVIDSAAEPPCLSKSTESFGDILNGFMSVIHIRSKILGTLAFCLGFKLSFPRVVSWDREEVRTLFLGNEYSIAAVRGLFEGNRRPG